VSLAKQLDASVAKSKSARLRAVVILLSEDERGEQRLKALSGEEGIGNVSLAYLVPPGRSTTSSPTRRR